MIVLRALVLAVAFSFGATSFVQARQAEVPAAPEVAAPEAPADAQAIADRVAAMPLIPMPASGDGDTMVVFYSGDGGWAKLDRGVSAQLVAAGLPVVGVSSLRYFLTPRTAEGAAADLAAVIDTYAAAWGKSRVILVGFSFGAGALPAIVPALPAETRARVRALALVAMYPQALLSFKVTDWLVLPSKRYFDTTPLVEALAGLPMVCIYGEKDVRSACPTLPPELMPQVRLPGGHQIDQDHDAVARAIIAAAP